MNTIKAMVVEKLRHDGRSVADDNVKKMIRQKMKKICERLPNDTPEGQEFAGIMSIFMGNPDSDKVVGTPHNVLVGKAANALVEKAFNALLDKIMGEHDNLGEDDCAEYKYLRQRLVVAIKA